MKKKQLSKYLLALLSVTQLLVAQPIWAKESAEQPTKVEAFKSSVVQNVRSFKNKTQKALQDHPFIFALVL